MSVGYRVLAEFATTDDLGGGGTALHCTHLPVMKEIEKKTLLFDSSGNFDNLDDK